MKLLGLTIDDEAINLIRQQVLAEQQTAAELKRQNDLAEQALRQAQGAEQKREIAEQTRIKISFDTNEKVAGLNEALPKVFLAIYGIEESLTEIARRIDRLDELELIRLTGRGNGNKTRLDELKNELLTESLQRELAQYQENLQGLQEQKANFGIEVPLKLLNQIKQAEKEIARLERKIEETK